MSFHGDKKQEHLDAAEKALKGKDKDYQKAFFHMAKAAEFGFKLAEQSEGKIAESHAEDASELLVMAAELKEKASKKAKKAKQDKKAKPQEAEHGPDDEKQPEWLLREKPNVSFDDIIGLDDLKERVKRFIVKFKNPDEVAKWAGARLGDRMIVYGPPGTGKTMFAKAIANEIDADFFQVKGSNLMDKWVGESQKNVKRLFEAVGKSERTVVFLDELDGILSKRGSSSTVRDSVVSEFLQEMEGVASPNTAVLFIGATNLPSSLDDAVVSRFGGMFFVPLPSKELRQSLLEREFKRFPYGYAADISLEELAERLDGHSMRSVTTLIAVLTDLGIARSTEGQGHQISSADVDRAFRDLPAPLSPKEIKRYERFAAGTT